MGRAVRVRGSRVGVPREHRVSFEFRGNPVTYLAIVQAVNESFTL